VPLRFSFCGKGSFDFCGKSKLVRGMDLESSLLLEAYSLDVAASYCTEAPFGYLKLKLDCISGFLHPECDNLFLWVFCPLLIFFKKNSIPAVIPLSGR
jgi:hypothetical protein